MIHGEKLLRQLPNYMVTLRTYESGDLYMVRELPSGKLVHRSKEFNKALLKATMLQEAISVQTRPDGFQKIRLISIGGMTICRTVKRRGSGIYWTYIGISPQGEVLVRDDSFFEICITAINDGMDMGGALA